MGSTRTVTAPAPRDYGQEMQQALQAQIEVMPGVISAQKRFLPQLQDLQRQTLMGQIGVMEDVYNRAIPVAGRLSQAQVASMTPAFTAIAGNSRNIYRASMGDKAAGILDTLESQAASELSLGKGLSDEEITIANQAARGAAQARGLGGGGQAIAMEVLSNYDLSRQREAARRQFAGAVYGMSSEAAGRAYAAYGAPAINMLSGTTASGLVQSADASKPSNPFNPESSYNAALITANRKEQMDAEMFNAQQENARSSAMLGAAATIGGAFLGGPAFAAMMAPAAGAAIGGAAAGGIAGSGLGAMSTARSFSVPASTLSLPGSAGYVPASGNALLGSTGGVSYGFMGERKF